MLPPSIYDFLKKYYQSQRTMKSAVKLCIHVESFGTLLHLDSLNKLEHLISFFLKESHITQLFGYIILPPFSGFIAF